MALITPDSSIASRYDPLTGFCHYVFLKDGKPHTVSIKRELLDKHPQTPEGRRLRHSILINAMRERFKGEPDPDPRPGEGQPTADHRQGEGHHPARA